MTGKLYKVEGYAGLMKDPRTGVVMNTNSKELSGARKRKAKRKDLENEITDLRSQVENLTSLIEQLVEK